MVSETVEFYVILLSIFIPDIFVCWWFAKKYAMMTFCYESLYHTSPFQRMYHTMIFLYHKVYIFFQAWDFVHGFANITTCLNLPCCNIKGSVWLSCNMYWSLDWRWLMCFSESYLWSFIWGLCDWFHQTCIRCWTVWGHHLFLLHFLKKKSENIYIFIYTSKWFSVKMTYTSYLSLSAMLQHYSV